MAQGTAGRHGDMLRLAALTAGQGWRLAVAPARRLARRLFLLAAPRITRIALAPDDLRPPDPRHGGDIADGIFELAAVAVDCRGRSPFTVVPPSPEWEDELHRFRWLRHLAAHKEPEAPQRARALVAEWARYGSTRPLAQSAESIAERLMSWLYHAPFVLEGASPGFHGRFLELVNDETRMLAVRFGEGPDGLGRIRQAAALALVCLACPDLERRAARNLRRLDRELTRQVLTDGCHVSRNPEALIDLLADILPIRTMLAELGLPASRTLMGTIDRTMPMLRFFRHADGAMALFNGSGHVAPELLASIFLQDDARARPPGQAQYGGYHRLESGRSVVLIDTGTPPPIGFARQAHMAPLAMELSSGRHRFIVSTGVAVNPRADWRRAAREAAAHSTLVMNDDSPGEILESGPLARLFGPALVEGARHVSVERQEHQGVVAILARHDGYVPTYGLWHERTLRLSARGDRLDGRDRTFAPEGRKPRRANLFLRFHIHPGIRATLLSNGVVILMAEDGEAWEFRADGVMPRLEPSVFLAAPQGPKANEQIVLAARGVAELRWTFHRSAEPRAARAFGFDPPTSDGV